MYAKYTADGKSGLFRVLHPNIAVLPHFVYAVGSYTSTHSFEDVMRGAAATRKGAPSTRREYEVAGAL